MVQLLPYRIVGLQQEKTPLRSYHMGNQATDWIWWGQIQIQSLILIPLREQIKNQMRRQVRKKLERRQKGR